MKVKRLWVLMGGLSLEHEVSLTSGEGIVNALLSRGYKVLPVVIAKDGSWSWPFDYITGSTWSLANTDTSQWNCFQRPALNDLPKPDLAFLGLHGFFGEDGRVQALLEYYGIAYTGSGVLGSALAMDKLKSKEIYKYYQLPTPRWTEISRSDWHLSQKQNPLASFPVFCKDPIGGSSLGMGRADHPGQFQALMDKLFKSTAVILIEPMISGREFSCGYLQGGPRLPATEIVVNSQDFFDYSAKYQGKSEEITPAKVTSEKMKEMQFLAKAAHEALGLSGYSRTDFLMDQKGHLWILETNSLPGFTPQSLLPQQADQVGMDYPDLVEWIVNFSLNDSE